ncbi:MAG: leucyl-tRNA synthetase [Parcubacteria group bacterium Licking1014_17]|nr:MAG: leucyl-tRNA synthetase [Parcubacteria group bacterium Licking1014_17]
MKSYDHQKTEKKWLKKWLEEKIYQPDLAHPKGKGKFYNLMMFPYPSAEGLHVGNMYAFTGSDIYGRFKRMQGYDVFEPFGLDGFGIHSENYAIKIGTHPVDLLKKSEKRYYEQVKAIGNGFAWDEKLETYDPEYYKWTQWIFVQMFKHGLAYRKKAPVNWCPSCKTVLADEQVIAGKCERCGTEVIRKELEQWFFKITDYAEKLLKNLDWINWSERVKIAQRNWIGKSEGAGIDFEIAGAIAPSYVLLHGYTGSPENNFFPWLKKELEKRGARVYVPELPNTKDPIVRDQVEAVLKNVPFDGNTIIVGHSLGGVVVLKILEKLSTPVRKTVLVGCYSENRFIDENFPLHTFDWKFNPEKIKCNAGEISILRDLSDDTVPQDNTYSLYKLIGGELFDYNASKPHFSGNTEPEVLHHCIDSIRVFTTRPDTLFGTTYMVLAPEYEEIENLESKIENWEEVQKYIERAKNKSNEERITEGKDPSTGSGLGKTGVELKGVKAINPANNQEIPIWIADYVLRDYGTGAIMAVPAHDERDREFAKKFDLPVSDAPLVDAKEITKKVGGEFKTTYRLRDWLISRQRYWGPPIPMIHCDKCSWQPVPEEDLPVVLPYVKDFKPTGTDASPLTTVKEFYETKCPKCGGPAKRETDVSDNFFDSAWYYFRYPSAHSARSGQVPSTHSAHSTSSGQIPFDPELTKKWLPVDMYIGGAEHSVLHLFYTRFVTMAFKDWGLIDFEEPFHKFRAHGLLIKEDAKMSKSKGNIVNPDEYIEKYGADVLRMYLMFIGPFEQGGDFRDDSIIGIARFLGKVWAAANKKIGDGGGGLPVITNKTIKKVTEDIENLRYNTAISALMIFLNEMEKANEITRSDFEAFIKLLAPFAPFITEEIWRNISKHEKSVHIEPWPEYDPSLIKDKTAKIPVQVNGKLRAVIEMDFDSSEEEVVEKAKADPNVQKYLPTPPKKTIFVKNKLVNFVL